MQKISVKSELRGKIESESGPQWIRGHLNESRIRAGTLFHWRAMRYGREGTQRGQEVEVAGQILIQQPRQLHNS